ncbi:MAG: hypothetical protein DDT34_01112 [Firmicutes bacterium]|nr:hypothetical protein [Bacillota bacterium]
MRRVLITAVLWALTCGAASAQLNGGRPPTDDEIAQRASKILQEASKNEAASEIARAAPQITREAKETYSDVLRTFRESTDRAIKDSMAMFEQEGKAMLEATGEAHEYVIKRPLRYRVFVSQSMPREEIRQLVLMSQERQDTVIVFRGVKKGQKITDLFEDIVGMLPDVGEAKQFPSVEIDPQPFHDVGIDAVPVIARYDEEGTALAWVSGITSPAWIEEEIGRGRRGNVGQFGSVVPVIEQDMIEAFKQAAASIPTEGAGERALNRYFLDLHQEVGRVSTARVRELDPSFVVEETITLPTGEALVTAGTVINPLAQVPFTSVLIVFDPLDPAQVAVARQQIAKYEGRNVMLLVSSLAHTGGLEGYAELVQSMGRHIYFLTKEVRQTFDIQLVPAVVTAEGLKFRIEEIPPQ